MAPQWQPPSIFVTDFLLFEFDLGGRTPDYHRSISRSARAETARMSAYRPQSDIGPVRLPSPGLAKGRHSELFFSLHGSMDRGVFAVLFNEKVGGAVDIDVGSHVQGRFRATRIPLK